MWELPCLKLRVRWAPEEWEWALEAEEWEWAPEVEEWALAAPVVEAAPMGWVPMAPMALGALMVGRALVVAESLVWEAFTETRFFQDMVEIIFPFLEDTIGIAMETVGHFKSLRKSHDKK